MPGTLFDLVADSTTLLLAWNHVRESGLRSKSESTKNSIRSFDSGVENRLARISSELLGGTFDFGFATAVPIKREGKDPRPLLVADIPARIVQRALLDVLQRQEAISEFVHHSCSYGGLSSRNKVRRRDPRAAAILHAGKAIQAGAKYVIRSDIPGFFTRILRRSVLVRIQELLDDNSLSALLESATNLEIRNASQIYAYRKFFPDGETGVAQGCCLSPLFGNIYLRQFDDEMNTEAIVTLRYIDDFVILGPNQELTRRAFGRAKEALQALGLDAYEPASNKEKAAEGEAYRGFDFLGCKILPHRVEPSALSRKAFLSRIRKELDESAQMIRSGITQVAEENKYSLVEVLARISRMIRGWTEQYKFCNETDAFRSVDYRTNKMIDRYLRTFFKEYGKDGGGASDRRRILGIWLATDCDRNPILPLPSDSSTIEE